jgi:hypothetical protein
MRNGGYTFKVYSMTQVQFKKMLEKHHITNDRAAWLLGLDVRQIRRYLSGESPVPQAVDLLMQIFDAHLITMSWLEKRIEEEAP